MTGPRYLGPPLKAPPRYLGPPLKAPPEHLPRPAVPGPSATAAAAAVPTLEHYVANLQAVPIAQRSVSQQGELATYQARLTDYMGIATPSTASAPVGLPSAIATPTGSVPIGDAAQFDASNLAAQAAGYPAIAAAAPFAGLAAASGYNGVIGVGTGNAITYHVFRGGSLVASVPGGPTTDAAALAAQYGVNPNAFGIAGAGAVGPRMPITGPTYAPFDTTPTGDNGSSSPITAAGSGTPTSTAVLDTGGAGVPPAYGSASGGSPINGGGGSGQVASSGGGISTIDMLLIGGAVVAGIVLTKGKKGRKA